MVFDVCRYSFYLLYLFLAEIPYRRRVDERKRRDRLERSFYHWSPQYPGMVEAFMDWSFNEEHGHKMPEEIEGYTSLSVKVFDVFCKPLDLRQPGSD